MAFDSQGNFINPALVTQDITSALENQAFGIPTNPLTVSPGSNPVQTLDQTFPNLPVTSQSFLNLSNVGGILGNYGGYILGAGLFIALLIAAKGKR